MNINELKPIKTLNPFTKFCCTIGNLPSSYLDSMTYYEQLLWFCNFLEKTVIPTIDKNAEAVQELQNLFVELKNYVDNYFTNLDVQEEINNKLDEMANNGILETILNNYKKHKLIFTPISNNIETGTASGDCTILKTISNKIFMIDTGASHSYNLIKQELEANSINKIDYLLITHFHEDHIGNLENLYNDGFLTNTIFYLPKHTEIPDDINLKIEDFVLNIVGENTKIFPNNGTTLTLDDIIITFFNCNKSDIDFYDTQNTTLNNYSICCKIICGNFKAMFTGDVEKLACERIYEQGYLEKVDVMKAEHHGYQIDSFSNYNITLQPTHVIIPNTSINSTLRPFNSSPSTNAKLCLGANIYCVDNVGIVINFDKNSYKLSDKNKFFANSYNIESNVINIYVDQNFEGISDGTENKPFKSLNQAFGFSQFIRNTTININIQEDYSSNEYLIINNQKNAINIIGNINCNRLIIYNSNVNINGNLTCLRLLIYHSIFECNSLVTVSDNANLTTIFYNSTVNISNLTVNGTIKNDDPLNARGVVCYYSKININNDLTISNKSLALAIYNDSIIRINNLKGINNTYGFIASAGTVCFISSVAQGFANNREYNNGYTTREPRSQFVNLSPASLPLITANEDLNNYKTPGEFVSPSGSITISLLNIPQNLGYAMKLKVDYLNSIDNIIQIIISGNLENQNTGIFTRIYNPSSNSWSEWKSLINNT